MARFISSGQSELPNEDEKTLYCAFSFPAVAYTLGRKYWLCIRSLYNLLARDIRVRMHFLLLVRWVKLVLRDVNF